MLHKVVDNRGLSCPQPVLNTKKALEELRQGGQENFELTVIVDNDIARENVTRLVKVLEHRAGIRVEEREDGIYLFIQMSADGKDSSPESGPEIRETCAAAGVAGPAAERPVLLVTAATLGQGSAELGKILMRSFIYSLTETERLPAKIYFLNNGVFLTAEGSAVLEGLRQLVKAGVEIYSCGTCLDYYGLKDKLAVGEVTNIYDLTETLLSAAKCVTL